jgi:succinate dehydrogenase/fumarate reductase-like Fe-S protein
MRITLHVWRQEQRDSTGGFARYVASGVTADMSFLEMLDLVNEDLTRAGQEPIAFDHDCREGICGSCGFLINGVPHGELRHGTVCQLYMRHYQDGDELWLEPWRAAAFPLVSYLPQGLPERERRVLAMADQLQAERFGACGDLGECEAVCPSRIDLGVIALLNREYLRASLFATEED